MAEYYLRTYRLFERFPLQILLYVGEDPLRMSAQLNGPDFSFRYRIVDMRDLDGDRLLESESVGDNIIAILGRLRDQQRAVRQVVERIAELGPGEREAALSQLMILSGLRRLEEFVEQEVKRMPLTNDILDHKVLGREYKRGLKEGIDLGERRGEVAMLRRLIEKRFGSLPAWAEEQLARRSALELEDLGVRVLDATSLEELLQP